jgi:agmatine deiminase
MCVSANQFFNASWHLRTHWELDEQIAQKVQESENAERYITPIVAKGGAMQCDGEGTLITTRQK